MVGSMWSNNLENYAIVNVATRRATHAEQDKGDDPDQNGYREPPGLG
jgi:hypothetical protein